ncbi:hypothetical protein A4R27_26440 (plasmid) [Priestia endophytica]|nr:hypothetical protein A4R27_26440 [Priestia endophytica]
MEGEKMAEQENEFVFLGGEVSKNLGIPRSSLTKYCLALEEKGYRFIRYENNSRAFTNKDIILLQRMKDLVREKKMTMETSAQVVLSKLPEDEKTGTSLNRNNYETDHSNEMVVAQEQRGEQENKAITLIMKKLEQFNDVMDRLDLMEQELKEIKSQNELLQEQNEQLQTNVEASSSKRDEKLVSLMREVQETRKMIATAKEKKWWKFW